MLFIIFAIIAAWNLSLPLWLQVWLTISGVLAILFRSGERVVKIYYHDN